ncbi:hypothetical protein [Alterinioella nitratireducens]|uniref:hypothetical protein n=1 Tax=Alterinioella nitratireducens TaxID=2735915 RepID=UPI001557E1B7|nr:hypothetical protein [Alterinioella nitratireducens]NPD18440.1 hypothetical protein [Alterinioella nitratireducens]
MPEEFEAVWPNLGDVSFVSTLSRQGQTPLARQRDLIRDVGKTCDQNKAASSSRSASVICTKENRKSLTGLSGRARLAGRLRPVLLSVATTCCRVGSKRVICIEILNEAYSVIKVYFDFRGGECPDSHWPAI